MAEAQHGAGKRWMILVAVTVVGFFLDWFTKYLIVQNMTVGQVIPLVKPFVEFLFVRNRGAIFGINPGSFIPGFPVNLFFYLFTAVAVVLLVVYYHRLAPKSRQIQWAVALILPGALGNFYDRLINPEGGVVDFIKIGINERLYWPIFNVADIYISVGVGLLLLAFWSEERDARRVAKVAPSEPRSAEQGIGTDS